MTLKTDFLKKPFHSCSAPDLRRAVLFSSLPPTWKTMKYVKCPSVCLIAIVAALALLARSQSAAAQSDEIAPNANLEVYGIPKPPASLAPRVRRYSIFFGLPLA